MEEISTVTLPEVAASAEVVVRLRAEESTYAQIDLAFDTLPRSPRVWQDLKSLLTIPAALLQVRDAAKLLVLVLEKTMAAIPADLALLVLSDPSGRRSSSTLTRTGEAEETSQQAAESIDQVFADGVCILRQGSCSVAAAPFLLDQGLHGCVCLQNGPSSRPLSKHHLHLLAAIVSFIAPILGAALRLRRLETENQKLKAATAGSL